MGERGKERWRHAWESETELQFFRSLIKNMIMLCFKNCLSQQKTFLYDFWKEKQVITAISYRSVPCLFFLPQHFQTSLSVKGQAQFAMKSERVRFSVNDWLQPFLKGSWRLLFVISASRIWLTVHFLFLSFCLLSSY